MALNQLRGSNEASGSGSGSGGRKPMGEVIVEWADGGSYSKQKLEDHVLSIERRWIEKQQAEDKKISHEEGKKGSEGVVVNEEDVDYLTQEFSIPQQSARSILISSSNDRSKAIEAIIRTREIPGI